MNTLKNLMMKKSSNIKVYVIEEFIRNDEDTEHGSEVVAVYLDKDAAIRDARELALKNLERYSNNMREDEEHEDNLVYYCCLDADDETGDNNNYREEVDYMVITVTEHKLKEDK